MKALILAAGRGTRISRYLNGNPKCTVNIGDDYLISHTVKQLYSNGIEDIGIVLGYKKDIIMDLLKDFDVKYFYNPFFDVTNSIASAWFARSFIDDDMLIMNGDVFLEDDLIEQLIKADLSPVMFADGSRKEEADYKFKYEDGILKKYGKELTGSDITGEYIGVSCFSNSFSEQFIRQLNSMIERQEHSVWWENVLYTLSSEIPINIIDIAGKFWAEVDYIEDYERILRHRGFSFNDLD